MSGVNFIILSLLCLGSPAVLLGQGDSSIKTNRNFTPEQLVQDVFLRGNCINVTNIKPVGHLAGIGYFSNGEASIDIKEGVVLATGNIANAHGPNDSKEISTRFNDNRGDGDLAQIATNSVADVVGLEFDFTPFGNTVTFEYVFASEEYCEFVGSIYNDVFGFFVSGPGINGPFSSNGINVALIPGTEEFVSINNVNHEDNSSFYVKNEREEDARQCNISYSPARLEIIEYDGFTTKLQATISVIPCETYHIRLLVADVGDDKLDSAVFLAAKSFDLGETVYVRAEVPGSNELVIYEGCQSGQFVFERTKFPNTGPELTVNFTINPFSTAMNGIDFEAISSTLTIPAGTPSVSIPIISLFDSLDEPPERLLLELTYPCDCIEKDSAFLFIADAQPLSLDFLEAAGCAGQDLTLRPIIEGGASPFSFQWSTQEIDSTVTVPAVEGKSYSLTITDACEQSTTASIITSLRKPPEAYLSGEAEWCRSGNPAFLSVELSGQPPFSITYTVDSLEEFVVKDILGTFYNLQVAQAGKYNLTSVQDAACSGEADGTGIVRQIGVQLAYEVQEASCMAIADGSIKLNLSGGKRPYSIEWDTIVTDDLQPAGLAVGRYTVKITDAAGCVAEETIVVNPLDENCSTIDIDPANPGIYIPNAFSPNGDGENDTFQVFQKASTVREIRSLRIFDRWGEQVHESKSHIWNGQLNGKWLAPGIYTCMVEAVLVTGKVIVLTSDVTLIR